MIYELFSSNSNNIMSLQTRFKPTEKRRLILVGFEFHDAIVEVLYTSYFSLILSLRVNLITNINENFG